MPESLDLLLLDRTGSDLSVPERRGWSGSSCAGTSAGPSRARSATSTPRTARSTSTPRSSPSSIDTSGVAEAGLKVVVDTGAGAAALVLPRVLSSLAVSVLTVNNRLDEDNPTSTGPAYHAAMARLAELVSSSRSDLGVRFDPTGERLSMVDETGRPFDHGRALLVMLDLVAAERRSGVIALPAHTTRVAEEVTNYHSVGVVWTGILDGGAVAPRRGSPRT